MKRPTVASLKKVTPENLAGLGVERLAEILVAVADTRPEVKRRLRMELAAEQAADHLSAEIDRRLGRLETARTTVSWCQRLPPAAGLSGDPGAGGLLRDARPWARGQFVAALFFGGSAAR
jgi:hypothetical protein